MSRTLPERSAWTLRFRAAEVERGYQAWRVESTLQSVRTALLFGALVFSLKYVSDFQRFPDVSGHLALLRLGIGTTWLLATLALTWWGPFRRRLHDGLLLSFLLFAPAVFLPFFLVWPQEYAAAWLLSWVQLLIFATLLMGLDYPRGLIISAWILVLFRFTAALVGAEHDQVGPATSIFLVVWLSGVVGLYLLDRQARDTWVLQRALEEERMASESLLRNVLPDRVVERLKQSPARIADYHDDVSVLFADLVGFSVLAQQQGPVELVDRLDALFSAFDDRVLDQGLEKIKTVGDAYMVAGNLWDDAPTHLDAMAGLALELIEVARLEGLELRVGMCVGPVVAGVLGRKRVLFDIWGDTVNTAARMESHGLPGRVQVTGEVVRRLKTRWRFTLRGNLDVKGKGEIPTWWLDGPARG